MDTWKQYQIEELERRKREKAQFAAHQDAFSCRTCGRPSIGPSGVKCEDGSWIWDWNKPIGLIQCSAAGQWYCPFCFEQYHKPNCEACTKAS